MECRCNQIQSSQKAKKYHKDMLFCFSPAFSGQDTAVTQVTSTMPKKTNRHWQQWTIHVWPPWTWVTIWSIWRWWTPDDCYFSAKLRRASSSTAFQPGRPHGRKNRRLPRLWHFSGLQHKSKTEPLTQSYIPHLIPLPSHFFCTNHIKSQPLSFTSPSPHP